MILSGIFHSYGEYHLYKQKPERAMECVQELGLWQPVFTGPCCGQWVMKTLVLETGSGLGPGAPEGWTMLVREG